MIRIGMDPDMLQLGALQFTWHGFFTLVGVVVAVFLVARWARREGLNSDMVYSTALWAIVGGILGARLVHVVDQWSEFYRHNPWQILAVWQGGIAIYGAILGGFVGGTVYARFSGFPVGRLADLAAPALLLAMAIGRIGDIINGEHCSKTTSMPWGFVYTHPDSPARFCYGEIPSPATHPAVVYEMFWDLAVFALLWWVFRWRLKPDGMLFVLFLALYSVGRLFISFLREDKVWLLGLNQAQLIALILLLVTVPLLLYRSRLVSRAVPAPPAPPRHAKKARR